MRKTPLIRNRYVKPTCTPIKMMGENLIAQSPITLTNGGKDTEKTTGSSYNWGEVKTNTVNWEE